MSLAKLVSCVLTVCPMLINSDFYRKLVQPVLFTLPPETAQSMGDSLLHVLSSSSVWRRSLQINHPSLLTQLSGIPLHNPIGLAAGYDKNCDLLVPLSSLGFGYLVGGTVTLAPRTGHPKPRLIRYKKEESLANSLGFPSKGLTSAIVQLRKHNEGRPQTPVIASISGTSTYDVEKCHRELECLVAGIEVNISSPNTDGLRIFQLPENLRTLITSINKNRTKPLFIKLPPYPLDAEAQSPTDHDRESVVALAKVCAEEGVSGVTVSNTWPIRESRLAIGTGGLSGRLNFGKTIQMVTDIKREFGSTLLINACGGIASGKDAWEALTAGATTIQLLTSLVYSGPSVVKDINEDLIRYIAGINENC